VPPSPGCVTIDLAVGGTTLFWTDTGHGAVLSRPFSGGPTTPIAQAEKGPSKVAVVGNAVYWLWLSQTIRRSVNGGTPVDVVHADGTIGGFVVSPDGNSVYFSSGTTIQVVSASGGVPNLVAEELMGGLPEALALSGNQIAYPTGLNGDVDVVTIAENQFATCSINGTTGQFGGSSCARLGRSQGELLLDSILFLPAQVVWADGSNLKSESAAANPPVFDDLAVTFSNNSISGLASTATEAYFADSASPPDGMGVIQKSPLAPNPSNPANPIRLARGQNGPRAVAVGSTKVYWSTADCAIESQRL
jgi:hypothetical protein